MNFMPPSRTSNSQRRPPSKITPPLKQDLQNKDWSDIHSNDDTDECDAWDCTFMKDDGCYQFTQNKQGLDKMTTAESEYHCKPSDVKGDHHVEINKETDESCALSDECSPQRDLREILTTSDDCWEADLSDDDELKKNRRLSSLSLEIQDGFMRRRMKQRKNNLENSDPMHFDDYQKNDIPIILPSTCTIDELSSNALFSHTNESTNNTDVMMSLPEQLLQKRLRRKQKLIKKHEQFIRFKHHCHRSKYASDDHQDKRAIARDHGVRHTIGRSHDNFNFLSGSPSSPSSQPSTSQYNDRTNDHIESHLVDDDNASIVASSNGSIPSQPLNELKSQITPMASLRSLPHRPIVTFPEEADRKRVIGCLAAILASSYAYETAPNLLVKVKTVGKGVPIKAENEMSKSNLNSQWVSPKCDIMALGEHNAEKTFEATTATKNAEEICSDTGHKFPSNNQAFQKNLFQTQSKPHSERIKDLNRNDPNYIHRAYSMAEIRTVNSIPSISSKPKSSFKNSISFSSFNNKFDIGGSQTPSSALTVELAEIRHRIRRHAVLSELLISSAKMLNLEPCHAEAFLPMLEGLLMKKDRTENHLAAPDFSRRDSWKGRGFGGGGIRSSNSHVRIEVMNYGPLHERDSSSIDCGISSTVHGKSSLTPAVPNFKSLCTPEEQIYHEVINTPESMASSFNHDDSMSKRDRSSSPSNSAVYSSLDTVIVEKEIIAPFLETMTPGAGFQCIALLLLNHLLLDGRGYDARVRHAFKRLAVVILSHELKVGGILRVELEDGIDEDSATVGGSAAASNTEGESFDDVEELALLAVRKFEAMEHAIANKLITLSRNSESSTATTKYQMHLTKSPQNYSAASKGNTASNSTLSYGRIALAPKERSSQNGLSKEQLLRGLKIGTAGAVGATLLALTGGLAAPGIAAGLAAVAGGSAVVAGVSTVFSSAAAVSTIFGVGGAGLAGYKMHRRTKGLTEFDFQNEGMSKSSEVELFSTVCISGWLRDLRDFQRPWGVSPSHPRIVDKLELLERFYFIHNPENVKRCQDILKRWKGRYFQLWKALREKYGTDPNNLFPLKVGPRILAELTHEEAEAIDFLFDELGYDSVTETKKSPRKEKSRRCSPPSQSRKFLSVQNELKDSSLKEAQRGLLESFGMGSPDIANISSNLSLFEEETEVKQYNDTSSHGVILNSSDIKQTDSAGKTDKPPPKHLLTVWDYHANYGGELYTVRWESDLLMELCDSVADQMIEWGIGTTKTILHTTALATLMAAVTIPYSLIMASNVIDDTWAMAMERADRAGVELAKSLIESTAGHRPVVLVGFSMGARVIYSCLKEMTRHQEIWEDQQHKKGLPVSSTRRFNVKRESADDKLIYVREPASIIEDAIMMGLPNHVSLKSWESCRQIIAGRLINCYSRKDMILSLMFQLKRMQGILRPVCGTSHVAVNGVENYDVTDLVSSHADYCLVAGEILKRTRHGQPQRGYSTETNVTAMETTFNIANSLGGFVSLAEETVNPKR